VLPQLKAALASRVIIEQAKGFLRERLDVEVEVAFTLLRAYARDRKEHLTDVAERLMTDGGRRTAILAALSELVR
jgi:AmiR/NasT family two-component response regulator